MTIKEEVQNIINKRWTELRNSKSLLSLHNIEKQTNQGYNGRQLLELFQNCEDEGASKVKINLDTKNQLLEISNDGNKPFSVKGYDSIFYPGLSSKVSTDFIGNKGLGFRSIINWATKISIISNGFALTFDSALKRDILLNKIGFSEQELSDIRNERKLNDNVYPLPLLNSCKIEDINNDNAFTTTISISYIKESEESIKEQLKSISEKTLLFLKNIETIEIEGDVLKKTISVSRKKITENKFEINYNGNIYYVIGADGIVDENLIEDKDSSQPKKYSVKIAYNDNLTFSDKVLYNYFKTQIPFELPFVAHASLELDQNRNHSTNSKVNPFVLKKLFQLHLELVELLKQKHTKSWLPYQSINNDDLNIYEPYSEIIDSYWEKFKVYPILSGKYVTSSIAKNLGNRIAEFIANNQLEHIYGEQIVFCDLPITPQQYVNKPDNYKEIIERLAVGLTIKQRARLVSLLLDIYPNVKFQVLIDEKDASIKIEDFVYTDKTTENKDLQVPSYSKIRFLNSDLYRELIVQLKLQTATHKSRSLKDKLETISDVHSFEPQTVIKKIISETDNYLKISAADKNIVIKEFYQKLFFNYKLRGDNPDLDYDGKIPCLNKNNEIIDIKTLVLSDEFQMGKLSNQIFGELYESENIITTLSVLGLQDKNIQEVEEFLKWLGVNPFSIIEKISSNIESKFIQYSNKVHNTSIHSYSLFGIKNFNKFLNKEIININQIICWLSLDATLKSIFKNYTETYSSSEKMNYSYYGVKPIRPFVNYIYYKLSKHFNIANYLITNKKQEWFNPFKVNYDYLFKINNNLDKTEVDRMLTFFGAKKDFNDLDINYLKTKTQQLADRKNEKGAQVFYKSLVGHYKKNEETILDVDLYARQGETIVVKNASKIYFSDRIQLPDSLTRKFPIFYYPSRSGGSRAIKMFGLKDLNALDLKIEDKQPNFFIKDDFQKFIKEIKPFILAFRLDKITKEDVKNGQVQLLNKLKIEVCSKLECSIDNEVFSIEPYNYIYKNNTFYFNIPTTSTIPDLKQKKLFRDNLSDVFLKVFDTLDEKKIFEAIIMQTREDNIYDLKNELAEGILEESKILLGEISVRLSIWKTIFKLKGNGVPSDLNENNIEVYIDQYYPLVESQLMFNSDDNLEELFKIRNCFQILGIDLENYNNVSDYKLSFDSLFTNELYSFYENQKKKIKNQVWYHLSQKTQEDQEKFIKYLYQIETLLNDFSFNQSKKSYDFTNEIMKLLNNKFDFVDFDFTNEEFQDYDIVENKNSEEFNEDEKFLIRKEEELNSLSYFEGYIDYIKNKLSEKNKNTIEIKEPHFNLNQNVEPELIKDFEFENINDSEENQNGGFWLGTTNGSGNGLSDNQKKKLGNNVEEVIKKYLLSKPDLYSKVELIAKTNESAHYDIKYFDIKTNEMKFVESKYYNGYSFDLSQSEREFGLKNAKQYEIWLVNKYSKIFAIKDINKLGKLRPLKYKVKIKVKEYAI
ncbi:hypothetical protein KUL113_46040 [Tenacibaculum sp. KUL113]|nr:hypothetical protein KUL113_46040 [Tenacibaculum sp. KUL113]